MTETPLPGVGVRHEFVASTGERVALLSHRTGLRELAVYDRSDPDACKTVLHLSGDDARTLAELLGGTPVGETVKSVQQLEGVAIDWIRIRDTSAQAGNTIGTGRLRTRTGALLVAIVRGDATFAAPGPEFSLKADDLVVAVGTSEGLRQLRELLEA